MTYQMTAAQLDKQASIAYVAEYHNRAAADAAEERGETNAAHNYAAHTAKAAAEGLYYSAAAAARRAAETVDPANARLHAATAARAAADAAAHADDAKAHADSITGTSLNDRDHRHRAEEAAQHAAQAADLANRLTRQAAHPTTGDDPMTDRLEKIQANHAAGARLAEAAANLTAAAARQLYGDDPTPADPVTVENHAATLDALTTEDHTGRMIDDAARDIIDIAEDYKERELTKREKAAAHIAARRWFEQTYTTTEAAAATAATLTAYLDPATLAQIAVETADEPARAAALAELDRHGTPYETRRLLDEAAAEADSRGRLDADPAELAEHYPSLTPIRADDDNDPTLNWKTTHAPDTAADRKLWRDDAAAAILRTFLAAHSASGKTDGSLTIDGHPFSFTLPADNRQIPIRFNFCGKTATIHAEHMTHAAALIAQIAQPA